MSRDRYDDVVAALYGALLDADEWPRAMQRVASFVGGIGTLYLRSDRRTSRVVASEAFGFDPSANELYIRDYADKEVRLSGTFEVPVGQPVTEQSLVDLRTLHRSEIYNELLKPMDIPYIVTFTPERSEQFGSSFVVERSTRHGPADRDAIERLQRLAPHLTRVIQVRRVLGALTAERTALVDWLEHSGQSVLFVADDARIVAASPAAERLLRQQRLMRSVEGRLTAAHAAGAAALSRAIAAASRSHGQQPATLRLAGPTGDMLVHVVPTRPALHANPAAASAMVIVADCNADGPSPSTIQTALGVTAAESRLLATLYRSTRLQECADLLGLSVHTCRTQLKHVYSRLGLRSRSELIRRLAQLPVSGSG